MFWEDLPIILVISVYLYYLLYPSLVYRQSMEGVNAVAFIQCRMPAMGASGD